MKSGMDILLLDASNYEYEVEATIETSHIGF
jgi:hypothetical protein